MGGFGGAGQSARTAERFFLSRSVRAMIAALGVGACALAFPPLALLGVALLALTASFRVRPQGFDLKNFAGPAFAALLVGAFVGLAGAVGVVFVWRLFADARWSARETARLQEAAGRPGQSWLAIAPLWLTPAFGLAAVAYTAPHMVAGLPLDLPHIPMWALMGVGGLAAAALFDWLLRVAADWRLGEIAPAVATHQSAHHLIFFLAYGALIDVSAGLLALLAWRLAHAALAPAPAMKPIKA